MKSILDLRVFIPHNSISLPPYLKNGGFHEGKAYLDEFSEFISII